MREFGRREEFDLALSLFTSFGYFDDRDEDLAVLGNVLRSLKPGGFFLIEGMGKERLAKIYMPTTSQELDDGSLLVQRHEIIDGWSRIKNEWILIREGAAKSYSFHHTVYSGRNQAFSVGAKSQSSHNTRIIVQGQDWRLAGQVPDPHRAVARCTGQLAPIRAIC